MEDIELGSSTCVSSHTSCQPSPVDFGNNPPLDQSHHNPDNSITKLIAELLSNPRPDSSVVIAADKVKDFSL
jgi:hypothetical protein